MEINLRKILILVFFFFFHGQRFENVEHGAMYSLIVTENFIIFHRNIYQVLNHVSVVSFLSMHLELNITNYHK